MFLRQLKERNEREWFKPRKSVYDDELVWPMQCLVAHVSAEAARRGVPLTADPKDAIFRIYRDTRFSKNKAPYKTHIGAVLTRSGHRKEPGGLYIHVEPGGSFVTGGFWQPENRVLQRWRQKIEALPDPFLSMMQRVEKAGLDLESEEKLKRMPRGFQMDPDHPAAEYMRWKSFLATRRVSDAELTQPAFAEVVVETAVAALPLLEFGWDVEGPATD